jgi:hypothetical protein
MHLVCQNEGLRFLKKNAGVGGMKSFFRVAGLQPSHEMFAKLFTVKILKRKIHHRGHREDNTIYKSF